jgi:hypothetical protein
VYDVNGDGLKDVVTPVSAHGRGISWFEQKRDKAGEITFVVTMRAARRVVLSTEQRDILEAHARDRSVSARSVERAWIVLLAAGGMQDKQMAAKLRIMPAKIQEVVRKTTQEKPCDATHWTTRSMAFR